MLSGAKIIAIRGASKTAELRKGGEALRYKIRNDHILARRATGAALRFLRTGKQRPYD